MNRKINILFLIVTFTAIILTTVLTAAVFYRLFRSESMGSLKTYTHVLADMGAFDLADDIEYMGGSDDLRITLISEDGKVQYDNEAEITDMDNHGGRPEVEEAFEKGEGSDVRRSTTLNRDTLYYAVLLDNNRVLRVAKETGNIWSLYETAFPAIIIIMFVLFGATVVLTHFLTRSIVKPIEQMANNMDNIDNVHAYKEMQPFIDVIYRQHEMVLKNAEMRQEFTANVSHEMKTPLTAISGYAELIENGMADKDNIGRFAKKIRHSSNRLLSLINDIIKLSELDAMECDMDFEDIDLYAAAQNVVATMQVSAAKYDVSVEVSGVSCTVRANRIMLDELLYNLIDNAIRYNNEGGSVHVSVCENNSIVELKVQDTGIGISPEHQKRVFERFYRVDKSRSKSTGGTGLGLAIVKHIVVRHNAEILLKSESGEGTEISVQFICKK